VPLPYVVQRTVIYEAIEVNDNMQEIIVEKNANELDIRNEAMSQGMITMEQDGILKSLMGLTTLSEVQRITEGDADDNKEILNDNSENVDKYQL